jgi:hypothetical protein
MLDGFTRQIGESLLYFITVEVGRFEPPNHKLGGSKNKCITKED